MLDSTSVMGRTMHLLPAAAGAGSGSPGYSFVTSGLLLAASLALGACSLPDDTAALVNDRAIATSELDESYEDFLDQFGELSPPGANEAVRARRVILQRLIDRELMMQEVQRRNLMPSEEEISQEMKRIQGQLSDREFEAVLGEADYSPREWRKRITRDLAFAKLQQEAVHDTVQVTEGEIEDYIGQHSSTVEQPEQVRSSQILVLTREEALEASRRIRGGEPFEEVAREVSLSPDGERGGDLGYFSRGQMPQEFDAVVFSLPVGELSPVVETTYGHHLFLVTDRREAHRRNDEEISREIRNLLFADKRERAFRTWMENLRAGATIRYNRKVVPP